jgi:hypothetical protein
VSRSGEQLQRRIEIGERLNLVLDGERLDLSIEALTDVLAMAIIGAAGDQLEALRIVEAVSGALPRRITQNWDAAKTAPAASPGSGRIQ